MVDENGEGIPKARIFFQRWRGHIDYFEFDHVNEYADEQGVWEWNEAPVDGFAAGVEKRSIAPFGDASQTVELDPILSFGNGHHGDRMPAPARSADQCSTNSRR